MPVPVILAAGAAAAGGVGAAGLGAAAAEGVVGGVASVLAGHVVKRALGGAAATGLGAAGFAAAAAAVPWVVGGITVYQLGKLFLSDDKK